MHRYALATEWLLATSAERVWDALAEPASWPRWWRYVDDVVLLTPGPGDGVGAIRRFTWSTPLGYRLTFDVTTTRIEAPTLLEGRASSDLQGTGTWLLRRDGGTARVRYEWHVVARKRGLAAFAGLLPPLFVWSHDRVMAAGARGLARHLGVPLLSHRRIRDARGRSTDGDRP